MPTTKQVTFTVYKAVLVLKDNIEEKIDHANKRIREIEDASESGWTSNRKKSLAGWEITRNRLERDNGLASSRWHLGPVIREAINDGGYDLVIKHIGEKIELDKGTFFNKTDHMLSFQLTRLRDKDIPAIKQIGRQRRNIPLSDEDYIGEFTEVLYDTRYDLVIIQSSWHGVGKTVVEKHFNFLYKQYQEKHNLDKSFLIGGLQPLIDETLIQAALTADQVKRFQIRCSDVNVDGIIPEEETSMSGVSRLIGGKRGVVLDIEMRLSEDDPQASLDVDAVRKTGRKFIDYINNPVVSTSDKKNAKMQLTIERDERSREVIDLITPKVSFEVPVQMNERVPVGSEYLYDITLEEYNKQEGRLLRLMGG